MKEEFQSDSIEIRPRWSFRHQPKLRIGWVTSPLVSRYVHRIEGW